LPASSLRQTSPPIVLRRGARCFSCGSCACSASTSSRCACAWLPPRWLLAEREAELKTRTASRLEAAFCERRRQEPGQCEWEHEPARLLGAFWQQVQQREAADRHDAEAVDEHGRPRVFARGDDEQRAHGQRCETEEELVDQGKPAILG
jgi:hypothetical protein